ncbi:MAG TPA: transcription antitermination factor NusB [Candidatus Deferrimicrobium sp.]|nr:transcription antitermination factor NusB [Candidatus Deferrimicrobium sp.]
MDILKHSFKFLKQFYLTPDKNLKRLLSNFLDTNPIESHQGITRTVYGVIRRELELDTIIRQLTRRTSGKIETDVLTLLRISIYLLIYSKSYPDYAVVNEAVQLSKRRTKGFVNAVLRRCAAERDALIDMVGHIEDPHIKYSTAPLLINHLKTIMADVIPVLEYLDREPVFHIRLNSKHFAYDEVKEVLHGVGLAFKELKLFDTFEVEGGGGSGVRLRHLISEARYFYFQNTASQLISIIAGKYAANVVLDCCTAPGAKSVTLSMLKPNLKIIANDIDEQRLRMVKEFCTAYDLDNIKPVVSDARALSFSGHFDFVILDAPCTSSGTLRKNPDLKLKITQELVNKNAENQYRILQSVLKKLSLQYLLYSVCSFIADETDNVLERTITGAEKKIEIIDLSPILAEYGFAFKKGKYGYYLLPNEGLNNDLFYLSLLKVAEPTEHTENTEPTEQTKVM